MKNWTVEKYIYKRIFFTYILFIKKIIILIFFLIIINLLMYDYNILLKVLSYHATNLSNREIEKITGVSKSTCCLWKKIYYNNYDNLLIKYNKNHKDVEIEFMKSLDTTIFTFLESIVEKNPMLTYKTFISLINTEFNIKLNNIKMKLILNKIQITKKRIRRRLIKSVDFLNQIIENRKKFKELIQKELIQNIISIDESGFNKLINSDTEGYSKIGTEINIPLPELTIKNTSLIMAVSIMGIINQEIIMDFVNKDVYFNFIKTTIEKLKSSYPDKQFIFIFDNVSFHHTNTTLELITKNNYKYYFIPPYSPNLNPI